jgi:hypothetical protein
MSFINFYLLLLPRPLDVRASSSEFQFESHGQSEWDDVEMANDLQLWPKTNRTETSGSTSLTREIGNVLGYLNTPDTVDVYQEISRRKLASS